MPIFCNKSLNQIKNKNKSLLDLSMVGSNGLAPFRSAPLSRRGAKNLPLATFSGAPVRVHSKQKQVTARLVHGGKQWTRTIDLVFDTLYSHS